MYNGLAVALAWPETFCKQTGAWYDPLMNLVGFNQKGYYQVGHAALLLIDTQMEDPECLYYDFGRYHAPHGHGRVRGKRTDHDLVVQTKPMISENGREILNLQAILEELSANKSCHGDGTLHASVTSVNFHQAFQHVSCLQEKDYILYSPFIFGATNCSRFVRDAIVKGQPSFLEKWRLRLPWMITPTPMWNLQALKKPNFSVSPKKYMLETV